MGGSGGHDPGEWRSIQTLSTFYAEHAERKIFPARMLRILTQERKIFAERIGILTQRKQIFSARIFFTTRARGDAPLCYWRTTGGRAGHDLGEGGRAAGGPQADELVLAAGGDQVPCERVRD
jgi:hypothetical protein